LIDHSPVFHKNIITVNVAAQAFANPESILRMAVDFTMGIENTNVAKKFQIRKTHDGIVFDRRSTSNCKSHESELYSENYYEKNDFKRSFNSSLSFDSGLRLSLDSGIQSPEVCEEAVPLPAEKVVWSQVRTGTPTDVNIVRSKKLRRGSFFAKADAQALLGQAVIVSVDDLSTFGRMVDAVKKTSQKLVDSQVFQNFITFVVIIAAITVGVETDQRGDPRLNKAIDFGCLLAFTCVGFSISRVGRYINSATFQFHYLFISYLYYLV